MNFDPEMLSALRDANEVGIITARNAAKPVIIWVVVADDTAFVRSVQGPKGRWYKSAAADGTATLELGNRRIPVRTIPVTDARDHRTRQPGVSRKVCNQFLRAGDGPCGSPADHVAAGTAVTAGRWRIGIDIGGTFTDVALVEEATGRIAVAKLPTTPRDFGAAVIDGIRQALMANRIDPADVSLLSHATTVVTNALLEGNGARAGMIATRGFRDILELRRSSRADLYDLFQDAPAVLIPRRHRFEITERIDAQGGVVTPLAEQELPPLIAAIREAELETVAVSLLFSFLNDTHERRVGAALRAALPDVPCICPATCCRRSASSSAPAPRPSVPASARCWRATCAGWKTRLPGWGCRSCTSWAPPAASSMSPKPCACRRWSWNPARLPE